MKRLSTFLGIILALVMLLCACGENEVKNDNKENENGKVSVKEIVNLSEYTIVRADNATQKMKDTITSLRGIFKDKLGTTVPVKTDASGVNQYEIIIGETSRKQSVEAFETLGGDYDYIIKLEGNHIVIVGGSEEATFEAVNVLTESFIQNGKLYAPTGAGHALRNDYTAKSFTVCGKDISEYEVYYIESMGSQNAKKNSTWAKDIRDFIGTKTGKRLPLVSEHTKDKNYIMVDTSSLNYTEGAIKVEDGNLILYGSFHAIDFVIDHFKNNIVGNNATIKLENGITELDSGDLPTVYSKQTLMDVLQYAYDNDDVLIVGDEIGGNRDVPSRYLEYYKNGNETRPGTGLYPAIMGVDMGRCGMLLAFLEDHEWGTISQIVCETIDYVAKGGIATYACHFRNPTLSQKEEWNSDRGNIGGEQAWRDLITPGTEINKNMMFELERDAKVLKAFDDAGVPIIWRPMHEMNGAWFWWTPYQEYSVLDAKYYVDFWRYIYDYFTNECGLDNLIWHYSPSTNLSKADTMYFYPGDEYCDILGVDWYTDGSGVSKDFIEKIYGPLMETGKIVNLAEIGIGDSLKAEDYRDQEGLYSAHDFFRTTIEAMRAEGLKAAFFATYTDVHTLAYLPGGDEIMASEFVIDLSEMPALFEKVTGFKVGE